MSTEYTVAPAAGPFSNRLREAVSPYLRQHAENPVDWYEWGPEALERARSEDKPIIISVGYAACHWCHVMAHESFEDPAVAAIQNEHFVSIKVDREERPDLDSLYMTAAQALTGGGGWPLNVFCLPDGTPFYAGTYFPPDSKAARYRATSWRRALLSLAEAYRTRREELVEAGRELLGHIERIGAPGGPARGEAPPLEEVLDAAASGLAQGFDRANGGLGGAPKFPQPMTLEFLLRRAARAGDEEARRMLLLTLDKMARGGIYDHLGGGFHRYAVDAIWLVPHFEKMLYDNALLARLYVEAFQATGEARLRTVAEETLDYLLREMRHPEGGFYSTQDADSLPFPGADHAEEGAFYVWSPEEVREVLGEDGALFCTLYDVSRKGNFEGKSILNLPRELAEVARVTGVPAERLREVAARGRQALYGARARRPAPFRDEKVLAAWNGMALRALAVAAPALGRPDYLAAAQACARFVLTALRRPDGRLLRAWKDGRAGGVPGFLEDYALVAEGLLALHAADGDLAWLREARALADSALDLFWDEAAGAFYDTPRDHERLVTRPRDVGDNATPSGNSAMTELLLRLAALTGEEAYRERAEMVLAALSPMMARFPAGFGRLLCAADLARGPIVELALVGEPGEVASEALLAVAMGAYRPNMVVARARPGDQAAAALTPLLADRTATGGGATAYVCQGFACKLPATTPEALAAQLSEAA